MGTNPEMDALRKARTKQKIIEAAFHVFAERTIDAVNMTDIAKAAELAMTTVYVYYSSKEPLVMDVSAWAWDQYIRNYFSSVEWPSGTAAEMFQLYMDGYIDLYRNHRDLLRFTQFFNVYVQRECVTAEKLGPFIRVVNTLAERFHAVYAQALLDGTLRTDIPEEEIFSTTLHLMLAAVTRYAVGLVYDAGIDLEKELELLKRVLIQEYRTGK
jgi:AcrR family transcriptional regulator